MALKTLQFPIVSSINDDDETAGETVPDSILEEILLWVPAKTILSWKTVSKSWLRMLNNPIFARTHFSRAPVCPLLVFEHRIANRSSRIMYLHEAQNISDLDPRISNSNLIYRIEFNTIVAGPSKFIRARLLSLNVSVVSCEGVVCWVFYDNPDGVCIYICNPITGEYASLSPLPMDENYVYVFIGMGFCRAAKRFELLRMSGRVDNNEYGDDDVSFWWPEVRVVGDRCWRRVGDGTSELDLMREITEVVYVNGVIYWSYSDYGDSSICCFHFDRALFRVIRLPMMEHLMLETNSFASENMRLGVLGDSLCVSLVSPDDGHVELVILENDGVSEVRWNKLCDVETKTTYMERGGVFLCRGQYKAIKYLRGGEILMHDWRGTFLIYNPITKEERHFCVLEDSCHEGLRKGHFHHLQVVPHVPCLVKLKEALGIDEECVKVVKEEATGKFWWQWWVK